VTGTRADIALVRLTQDSGGVSAGWLWRPAVRAIRSAARDAGRPRLAACALAGGDT
jgi:hypothetical protein